MTNGLVFAGHITDVGKPPWNYSDFGGPTDTPLLPSGIVMALNADDGSIMWQFNVGAQAAVGGPSIGNGYLLVPTGGIQSTNNGGYVVAFKVGG